MPPPGLKLLVSRLDRGVWGRRHLPRTVMKSVKLLPEQWERARRIGQGNAAEGIRRALDAWEFRGQKERV